MVHLGEAEVFERHVTQALQGFVWMKALAADIFEEFANTLRTHGVRGTPPYQ
jgi:hypothetical protein